MVRQLTTSNFTNFFDKEQNQKMIIKTHKDDVTPFTNDPADTKVREK